MKMSNNNSHEDKHMLHKELDSAVRAARKAGVVLLSGLNDKSSLNIDKKALNDFVTNIDTESERVIVSELKKDFPQYAILAEEGTNASQISDTHYWIIDPLDGTTNYMHHFPMFCVSIGLYHNEDALAGVVFDPLRNELFTAVKNNGAYLNGHKISVSPCKRMKDSLIGTGFPFRNFQIIDHYNRCFSRVLQNCQGIRRAGAATIDLAYVACGRLDAFWEHGLQPWDLAAAVLMITEAGGRVTDFTGNSNFLYGRTLVASNKHIHNELQEIVFQTMPLSYPI
jgi:myo-inositol-1(or 4)-monophosphatase